MVITTLPVPKPVVTRDPDATRKRILLAARNEYALHGLGGARVDRIAEQAGINKRMLYHYFGNKDDLYQHALEDTYATFRAAEAELHIERDDPVTAIKRLVEFTWHYYLDHPEFLSLVNTENLHKAAFLKKSGRTDELSKPFIQRMQALLRRGSEAGIFRSDVDAIHMLISIAAMGYHYLNNRYTGEIVYQRDMMTSAALEDRLAFNTQAILRMVCTPDALQQMEVMP
jgi:AcrR family transcriptional regulator